MSSWVYCGSSTVLEYNTNPNTNSMTLPVMKVRSLNSRRSTTGSFTRSSQTTARISAATKMKVNTRMYGVSKIDYMGFGLIALGLGTLQIVLDKGQRADWFETPYIRVFTFIFVAALILAVVWELRVKDPVVDLRLFKDRTFMTGNVMLFVLGFVLYSSTVLLPQYTQELMGYTAQRAGMMISPGGVAIMLLMPLIGFLITHYDARKLIAFGFLIIGVATLRMMRFNLGVDFRS